MSKRAKLHKARRQRLLIDPELGADAAADARRKRPGKHAGRETSSKRQRAAPQTPAADEGADEGAARRWANSTEEGETAALPVLGKNGRWKLVRQDGSAKRGAESSASASGSGSDDDGAAPAPATLRGAAQKSLAEVRREVAALAVAITEDCESNVGRLGEMMQYADGRQHPQEVVSLALLCTLATLKDILPGYYIRPLSEAEKTAKVSKDVKRVRQFEQAVLANYHRFFRLLRDVIQPASGHRATKQQMPVVAIAVTCVCELVTGASHFNNFEDVLRLALIAMQLAHEPAVAKTCRALRDLFDADATGHATMLALRLLSTRIKECAYDCPAAWLGSLETVRVRVGAEARSGRAAAAARERKKHMSGRERKEWKARQEGLRRMAVAEAEVSREERERWNSDSLKHLFRIYFGVLKHAPRPDLLPPVLAGLARHAHRIGVEYFADLLQSLRRLMDVPDGAGEMDIVPSLHCIVTVDRIHGMNESLAAMDLKFFYHALFRQIGRLAAAPHACPWDTACAPLQACLETLFHPKRHLPVVRVAAFAQRIADAASAYLAAGLYPAAVALLDHLRALLTHHTKAQSVLDREPFGQGAYAALCADPDLCNPFARSLHDVLVDLKNRDAQGRLRAVAEQTLRLR